MSESGQSVKKIQEAFLALKKAHRAALRMNT
jgi:hypothetical protein